MNISSFSFDSSKLFIGVESTLKFKVRLFTALLGLCFVLILIIIAVVRRRERRRAEMPKKICEFRANQFERENSAGLFNVQVAKPIIKRKEHFIHPRLSVNVKDRANLFLVVWMKRWQSREKSDKRNKKKSRNSQKLHVLNG